MLQSSSSSGTPELVFYVNERDDDFTFYLDCELDKEVIETLLEKKKAKAGKSVKLAKEGAVPRSFSERVKVRNLYLREDSLKGSEEFWAQLTEPESGSLYQLLHDLLITKKVEWVASVKKGTADEQEKLKVAAISKILNKQGIADDQEKQRVLAAISNILNEVIEKQHGASRWTEGSLPKREEALIATLSDDNKRGQWRTRFLIEQSIPGLIRSTQTGRGLICFSYVGRYLSVTFRKIAPDRGYGPEKLTKRTKYLFSWYEYCDLLHREVFKATESEHHAHGLLVITGSTNSGKSEVARGLINLFLERKDLGNRRKHLVTFEDPVEQFYHNENAAERDPWMAVDLTGKSKGKDYTPRQKEDDASALEEALTDALRQTPTLFFVGETRNSDEWRVLLNFAATGHLIVTTAHAGSLVEAIHRIFEAVDVKTAADRSEIANKLLAVIHLRGDFINVAPNLPPTVIAETDHKRDATVSAQIPQKPQQTGVVFPSLWRRTPRGIAALTSDGLASLLPYRPRINSARSSSENTAANDKEVSSFGRRWLIEQLLRGPAESSLKEVFADRLDSIWSQAYRKSTEWDLEGV